MGHRVFHVCQVSWPSTDFELAIQNELDALRDLSALVRNNMHRFPKDLRVEIEACFATSLMLVEEEDDA